MCPGVTRVIGELYRIHTVLPRIAELKKIGSAKSSHRQVGCRCFVKPVLSSQLDALVEVTRRGTHAAGNIVGVPQAPERSDFFFDRT